MKVDINDYGIVASIAKTIGKFKKDTNTSPRYLIVSINNYYDIYEDSNLQGCADDFSIENLIGRINNPKLMGLKIIVTTMPDVFEIY